MERYIHIETGMALTAPDGAIMPPAMYYSCGRQDIEAIKRARLEEAAASIGIDVPAKASKADIAKLIDERACEIFAADEAANAGCPSGVAPKSLTIEFKGGEEGEGSDAEGGGADE